LRQQVVLRGHSKSIGNAVEEGEYCDYVNRFRDLLFPPASLPELLNVIMRRAAGGLGDQLGIVKQSALGRGELSALEPTFGKRTNRLISSSLNPQEVGVTIDSIRTAVEG